MDDGFVINIDELICDIMFSFYDRRAILLCKDRNADTKEEMKALDKLEDFIINYDTHLLNEVDKRVESLEHQGKKISIDDYRKIVNRVHKKFKKKLSIYRELEESGYLKNCQVELLELIKARKKMLEDYESILNE